MSFIKNVEKNKIFPSPKKKNDAAFQKKQIKLNKKKSLTKKWKMEKTLSKRQKNTYFRGAVEPRRAEAPKKNTQIQREDPKRGEKMEFGV